MTQTLRWGLLSTARINNALIPPLRLSRRNKLEGVASRSQDKADAYKKKQNIPRSYGSYEALLAAPEIDVVYITLPNHLHAEWTIKALEAGKHVLCEKPLALTPAEVDAVANSAQKNHKIAVEAFAYRSHPQTAKIKELVESGKIGQIKLVRGSFTFVMIKQDDIRWNPEMGGGAIWDIGCYPLSFMRSVLGVEPVEAFGWQVTSPSGIDETFMAQLRFPGWIFAQFDCSFKIPHYEFMEIVGDKGTLKIPQPFNVGEKRRLYLTIDGKTSTIVVKGPNSYLAEVEDLADAILLGMPPAVSLADSRADTVAILALLESSKTGKPVAI